MMSQLNLNTTHIQSTRGSICNLLLKFDKTSQVSQIQNELSNLIFSYKFKTDMDKPARSSGGLSINTGFSPKKYKIMRSKMLFTFSLLVFFIIAGQSTYAQKTYCTASVPTESGTVAVTAHPSAEVVCLGGNASFSITASGLTPIYYQWFHNGDSIAGANNSTYNISGVTLSHQGYYKCKIKNLCENTVKTSDSVSLKVVRTSLQQNPSKSYIMPPRFSWNKRSGYKYIVFVKQTSSGSETPSNGTTYTANDSFKGGSQIGSTGWYCVYNGTDTSVSIKGLSGSTTYSIMLWEYTGTSGNEVYESILVDGCNPYVFTKIIVTPSVQANSLSFSNITSSTYSIKCTKGNGSKRAIFMASATSGTASPVNYTTYAANTSFGTGDQIGTSGWYCVYNGTDSVVSVTNLSSNTTYRVMVCEYNGTSTNEQYNAEVVSTNPVNQITDYTIPSTQASNIIYSSNSTTSISLSWTNGNGSNRVVFVMQGNSGTAAPIEHTTYTPNTVFGTGSQIGSSGWYCVYNGSGNSVSISGLTANTTYRVMVCEYNGTAGRESYFTNSATNNPINMDYIPSTQAYSITFSNVLDNAISIKCNKGNGTKRAFFILQGSSGSASPANNTTYTANTAYGSGTQIGTSGWYCIYNGTDSVVTVSNLTSNTTYRVMVCEYTGTAGREQYNVSTVTANPANQTTDYEVPTTQASNLSFTELSSTSFSASWSNGNGTERIVFVAEASSGSASPVVNTTYTANTTFGSGSQIGSTGWYCIYKGTGNNVSATGFAANTTYRVMVCEMNGVSGSEKYNTTSASNNPSNYYPTPTTQANSITLSSYGSTSIAASWTNGNGSKRAVFIKSGSSGTASPTDEATYTASSTYGSGSQIGSSGWYCVMNGTGTSVTITNLSPNTIYRAMVCEYNGIAGMEQYNLDTASGNPSNQITDYTIPSTQAKNIIFSGNTSTTATISWTNGNGTNRVVFAKTGNSGTSLPQKYETYTANATYGQGSEIGTSGWYAVYNGSGSSFTVQGLTANTTYRFMVCEYNGTAGRENYNTNSSTNNPLDYEPSPSSQATGISFSNITANGFTISCTLGNGTKRAIFIKSGTTGSAVPVNNTTYTASTNYGSGTQIGTSGWFCIYNGTSNTVTAGNLSLNTTYRTMVCEYNGIAGMEQYNLDTASGNPSNQITDYTIPSTQAKNIIFSGNTSTTATISWTNGNGTNRVVFAKTGNSGTSLPQKYETYTANATYGQGSEIGTSGWYAVYNGSGSSFTVQGLTANTTYRFMVCEYNGTAGRENYNTNSSINNPLDFEPIPSSQATGISFSNITANGFTISCTKGNGTKRAIFIKIGITGSGVPLNNTTYTANTSFGSGTQIGTSGWYCIYNGTSNTVSVSNLSPNTTYRVMAYDYNGIAGQEQYNIDTKSNNPLNQITDYSIPNIQANNLILSGITSKSFNVKWTNGNGSNRVVFVKLGISGTAEPVKHNTFIANEIFGDGSQIGSTGWYCVYNGNGDNVTVKDLPFNSSCRVMVIEYNGTAGRESYNIISALDNPSNYDPIPSVQAKSIQFTNITKFNCSVEWINGNGNSRIVFVKEGNTGDAIPQNNTTYTANTNFSSGSQIESSGWYCVFNGSGNSVTVGGLTPYKSYRFRVCEYNGSSGHEQYNRDSENNNPENVSTIEIQPVCMVTVDTITWKNKIIWEKPSSKGRYAGFNIYKETTTNNYSKVGTVDYDSLPELVDITSNPEATGYKYKITIFDTTNVESYLSPYHKTMNLTISNTGSTMGLRWDAYEDESGDFIPEMYYIYRGTSPSIMAIYDSISGSFTSYNDVNIFSLYYYIIGVANPNGCDIFRDSKPFVSFSNKKDNSDILGIERSEKEMDYLLVPNPFRNSTILTFSNPNQSNYNLMIYDATGKMVKSINNIKTNEIEIERGNLSKGIYFFKLHGEKVIYGKLMVE